MPPIDCKFFTGYKPCRPGKVCDRCTDRAARGAAVLIINLDALGAVMMTTALLPAIKRRDPQSTVHWVTLPAALPLLRHNNFIDKAWPYDFESVSILQAMSFDRVYSVDKSPRSDALAMLVKAGEKLGFGLDSSGAIVPFNPEAGYAYRLGIDDGMKFKQNDRSGVRILAEALRLDYRDDGYVLELTDEELALARQFREDHGIKPGEPAVGINTGCSDLYPNKKMTIDQHLRMISRIHRELPTTKVILLGGKAEAERNDEIRKESGSYVISSPTTEGLRRGIVYIQACDLVLTGDTAAMHIAIALRKHVVAWFGLSCAAEIELFSRGEKIASQLACAPCWKKSCERLDCLKALDLDALLAAVKRGVEKLRTGAPV